MFFNKKASERSSANGSENKSVFLLSRICRINGSFLHNKKGGKAWKFVSTIVAVLMLMGALTLLTGAVLDMDTKQVTLVLVDAFADSEVSQEYSTRQELVSGFLTENGIEIGEFDKMSMLPEDELYSGARLVIRKGRNFSVSVDGNVEIVTTTKKTVREAFEEAGIMVTESDRIEPSLDETVLEGMQVDVYRVLNQQITVDEEIPFKSNEVSDSSLDKGKTKIKVKGQNGLKRAVYNITTENGIEIKRELVSCVTVKEPVTQVVSVGTAQKSKSNSSVPRGTITTNAGKSLNYSKKLTVTATAYTDSSGNKTAGGMMPQYGVIAVDPKVIPLGTKLYVESTDDGKSWTYGYCIAGDTGGAIKGNKIDLFYNSESECVRFGRRTAIVYVLD